MQGFIDQRGFVFPVRVYFEDTDAAAIMYYARYLHFFERARTEALRHFGLDHTRLMGEFAIAFAVRRCETDYLRPAKLDDLLEVSTKLVSLKKASLEMDQEIHRDGEVLVKCRVRLACISLDGKPARIPTEIYELFRKLPGADT